MFVNFIYFIIVLLIYATYLPPDEPNLAPLETSILFLCLIIVFAYFTRMLFHRLEKQIPKDNILRVDHKINAIMTQQSVMAIVLFAIDIYGLSLTSFFKNIPLFTYRHWFLSVFLCFISLLSGLVPTGHIKGFT
ncbi:MAG: hypothetical protein JRJ25_07570 [Deltaproteobacteria bacterium]|nr:hypothetical protein [Deltaproteobacteria bacterium]